MQQDDVFAAEDLDRVPDLSGCRHAGGQDHRTTGGAQATEQVIIGQRGRGNLVGRHVELLEEVHRLDVPRRGKPVKTALGTAVGNRGIFVAAELDAVAILDIGHPAPRRVPLDVPLITRGADLRRTLLKFHRIASSISGGIDQTEGLFKITIVINSNLTGDVDGLTETDERRSDPSCWSVIHHDADAIGAALPIRLGNLNVA